MKSRIIFVLVFIFISISCYSRPVPPSNVISVPEETEVCGIDRSTVSFIAVGDNLMHLSVLRAMEENGVYNFFPIYSEIKYIIEKADLAFVNQETVMAGTSYGYTGYPIFNSPQSLAYAVVDAGFNIINLANNHALDMRAPGLYATLDFLDTIEGITVIGARRSGVSHRIVNKNDITFGFLAYSFSTGGFPIPRDNPNLLSLINREVMQREIAVLRPLCDFLIVSMHWGEEYLLEPDRSQTSLARFLADQNVDLIIGHHPHVLQHVETLNRPDGGTTLCFYSLGNFISNQRERERLIGGMAVLTFEKERLVSDSGEITEKLSMNNLGVLPVVSHFDLNIRNYRAYPLYKYNQKLLENHGYREFDPTGFTIEFFYSVLPRLRTNVILENPFKE